MSPRRARGGDHTASLVLDAPIERVFDAVSTAKGLRGWWTPLVRAARGRVVLRFEGLDEHIALRLAEVKPPSTVVWDVLEHTELDEFAGTRLSFALAARRDGRTALDFVHVGLRPELECHDMCASGWAHFLGSLAGLVERGEGEPFGGSPKAKRPRGFDAIVAAFAADPRVQPPTQGSARFGGRGLRVDGKIFAMMSGDAFVVKLPRERVAELVRTGAGAPYDAGRGRALAEWVAVTRPSAWRVRAEEARSFVGATTPRRR